MQIELRCPVCGCHFIAPPHASYDEVLDRMTDEGPWFALAEGDTFQDMIFAALANRGTIRCPDCWGTVAVGESSWGEPAGASLPCR
jgi:hypothetical protein